MMSWPSCTITVTLAQEMGLAKLNCISSKKPPSTYFFLKGVYFRITCLVQCGLLAYFHRGKFFARGNKINLCLDLVSHKISLQMLSLKKKKSEMFEHQLENRFDLPLDYSKCIFFLVLATITD